MTKMDKKGKTNKFKKYMRKIKSPFLIYPDFESILVTEYNEKQNSDECYRSKYIMLAKVLGTN